MALAASGVLISAYAAGTVSEGITSGLRASHTACVSMSHYTRSLDLTCDLPPVLYLKRLALLSSLSLSLDLLPVNDDTTSEVLTMSLGTEASTTVRPKQMVGELVQSSSASRQDAWRSADHGQRWTLG